ncbi:AAA family ATPase [Pseudonocardia bannensis]|uniref:AAA domain-containing protein n=1 Tax=Pseudonocardia bannensis TaxID=630973 RepID=A0A848DJW2_9PSEU|nr:AAA family ATPase [Pseudonocardia bannensis]NMH92829.1 AAA domain-containing protein [Pseudonocardia bannensis]
MTPRPPATATPPPIVGLRREREVLTVALATGRHVVIEGPPGTGKSTLLRSIARDAHQDVVFVEGNAELTPARLIGAFDPSQVLVDGYQPASFVDGPLLTAMRGGGLLYLEELNRVPEETLNVLITVLTEGEIAVPRLGTVHAGARFRLIAAMNPFDAIGTARVSQAIADRMCRVVLGYQDEPSERLITSSVSGLDGRVVELAVALTRATREHRDVRMGSSVRGAIDLALVLTGLGELRGESPLGRETARDAAYAALSGRIRIADGVDRTPESVIDELLDRFWPADEPEPVNPDDDADGPGKADGLPPPAAGFQPRQRPGREQAGRTQGRQQLAARHEHFEEVSPELGELDAEAFDAVLAQDPEAAAALLADLAVATDVQLRAAARRLAGRVFIQLGKVGPAKARGTRRLGPARNGEGDLDLDRTLDRWDPGLSGRPAPEDLVTRSWTAHRRAICLVVDMSGSMQGLAVALAAVAASGVVLAAEEGGSKLEPAVLAFSAGVKVLQPQGVRRPPEDLIAELVALRGHGTTDLAAGLREASTQLAGAVADERMVVLLSDCLHTAGDDPMTALGGIDRLHVLCPLPDAGAEAAAAALAARGGGISQPVRRLAEVGPALTRVLG